VSEILFKSLSIENFLSIGKGKMDLDSRGLLLIQGVNSDDPSANSNGAGKSSTVDALCWALFGVTARGLSGDSVVNRFEGKNCKVEIEFSLNGKTYKVSRHRKHSKGKNRLVFECDGADLTLGTDKLTQDSIEKTLGCTLEVFTASIYAGQNNMPNLPAMTDKELKQLVEQAAGIELLDASYGIARERLRTATVQRDSAASAHNLQVAHEQNAANQIAVAEQQAATWTEDTRKWIEQQTQQIQAQIANSKKLKAEIDAVDVAGLEARAEELKAELVKTRVPLPAIPDPEMPKLAPLWVSPSPPPALRTLEREVNQLQVTLNNQKRQLQQQVDQVRDLNGTVGTPCGECGKSYCEEDLADRRRILMEQINTGKAEFAKTRDTLADVQAKLNAAQAAYDAELEEVAQHNRTSQQQNEQAQEAYEQARREVAAKRQKQAADAAASDTSQQYVDALSDVAEQLKQHSNKKHALASQLDALRRDKEELDRLKAATNPYQISIETARENHAKQVYVVVKAKLELDAAEEKVEDATIVAELFSPKGMRGEVLDSVTPFLNARTAQYLGTLSDGSITAEWKTVGETGKGELREKFHIAVTNSHGADVFEGLSGGEQRKVRISTAMALQDLVASRADRPIKLFIADEADDALDVSGLERLMTILDEKARHVGTVLVISHNDLGDWISNSVSVVKSGGKSHIVEL